MDLSWIHDLSKDLGPVGVFVVVMTVLYFAHQRRTQRFHGENTDALSLINTNVHACLDNLRTLNGRIARLEVLNSQHDAIDVQRELTHGERLGRVVRDIDHHETRLNQLELSRKSHKEGN